jgi:hypothetical protein
MPRLRRLAEHRRPRDEAARDARVRGALVEHRYQLVGADALGLSEGAVKVALHRLRRRYRDALRAAIAETVEGPDLVDDEIRHLLEALSE